MLSKARGEPWWVESTRAGKEGCKGMGGILEREEQEGVILEAVEGGSGGGIVEEAESEMGDEDGWWGSNPGA